jgi:dTDP-4-amino-4,6-dideoxygalactose transaminase
MLTGDPEFLERARVISLHGMTRDAWRRYDKGGSWYYEVVFPGFKYNMTDIQAAIGLWQLRKLERVSKRRRQIVQQYHEAFANIDALEVPSREERGRACVAFLCAALKRRTS